MDRICSTKRPCDAAGAQLHQGVYCLHQRAQPQLLKEVQRKRKRRREGMKENVQPQWTLRTSIQPKTCSRPGPKEGPDVDLELPQRVKPHWTEVREAVVRRTSLCKQDNQNKSQTGARVRTEAESRHKPERQKRRVPRSAVRGLLCLSIHRDQDLIHVHIQQAQGLIGPEKASRGFYIKMSLTSDSETSSRTRTIRSSRPTFNQRFTLCVPTEPHAHSRLLLSVMRASSVRSGHSHLIGCMSFGVSSLLSKPVSGWFHLLSRQFGRSKHLRMTTVHKLEAASEHAINPTSQTEPGVVSTDGCVAPEENANAGYTSTLGNISSSANANANPVRADSGSLKINIVRGPDGFGFTISSDCPVRVQDVDLGGPAHSAGLRHGDALLQLNGVSVETWGCGQLAHAIRSCSVHISLVVWRLSPETTPETWPRPHPQEETKKKLLSGPANRRRGQRSLWRRSQEKAVEPNPAMSLHYITHSNQISPDEPNPPLTRAMLTGFNGEDYIILSPIDHSLTTGRATTIGRWYHPPATSRPTYTSATLPPSVAKTCYGDYQNCTIVQSHACSSEPGSIAPKTLIFPIHLKPIDLCSPGRSLIMSEDLVLHQPDLLPAKVTVMVYNDLLLFTKEDEIGRYNILQTPVYLDSVSLIEVSSKPLHLFFIRTARGTVQFSLEAYSLQQKHRLSICLHDNMQQLISMETQRLSLHDNIPPPITTETRRMRDRSLDLLAPPADPPSYFCSPIHSPVYSPVQSPLESLVQSPACSPLWKPRGPEEWKQMEAEDAPEVSEGRGSMISSAHSDRAVDSDDEKLRLGIGFSPGGLSRSFSEGSLLQEPHSPHFLSHNPVLTWPLRTSPASEDSNTPRPSITALKKHLTEGGSLQKVLELLYGTKAVEAGNSRIKKRTRTLVSLAFLQRRKNNPGFNSNSLEKALRNNRPAPEQVQRWSESLEALLFNQYGLAVFRHFLRSEFSDENLDFWLAVEKFKRTAPQKMVSKATKIYNEFISNSATRQVNIDSAIRELTNESLSLGISPASFQLAQDHIYNLMLTDSYPRFLKSRLYTQLANYNSISTSDL